MAKPKTKPNHVTPDYRDQIRKEILEALEDQKTPLSLQWYARMAAMDYETTLALDGPQAAERVVRGRTLVLGQLCGRAAAGPMTLETQSQKDWEQTLSELDEEPDKAEPPVQIVDDLPPKPNPPPPNKSPTRRRREKSSTCDFPASGINYGGFKYRSLDDIKSQYARWPVGPDGTINYLDLPSDFRRLANLLYLFDRKFLYQTTPFVGAMAPTANQIKKKLQQSGQLPK